MSELPLFPLSGVLLPFGRMPLQIFEQRYLDLVRDSLKTESLFGVVWIRSGGEIGQRGRAAPELGDYGTCARIVDWDQLSNGLLGITIEGAQRFDLHETHTRSNSLVVGQVDVKQPIAPAPFFEEWLPLLDVLRSLETHPARSAYEPSCGLQRRLAGWLYPFAVAAAGGAPEVRVTRDRQY